MGEISLRVRLLYTRVVPVVSLCTDWNANSLSREPLNWQIRQSQPIKSLPSSLCRRLWVATLFRKMTSSSRVCGEFAGDTESLSGAVCLSGENNIKRHQWCDVTVVFICVLKKKNLLLISVFPLKYDLQEATPATTKPHDELLCFSLQIFLLSTLFLFIYLVLKCVSVVLFCL